LGKDTFLLTDFKGTETVSDLFQFRIAVLSEDLDIAPDAVVGKETTVTIQDTTERKFNGYITSFTFEEIKGDNLREYRMVMVHWLLYLSQINDHRVFQDHNTKEIVSKIFNDLGFSDYEFRSNGEK